MAQGTVGRKWTYWVLTAHPVATLAFLLRKDYIPQPPLQPGVANKREAKFVGLQENSLPETQSWTILLCPSPHPDSYADQRLTGWTPAVTPGHLKDKSCVLGWWSGKIEEACPSRWLWGCHSPGLQISDILLTRETPLHWVCTIVSSGLCYWQSKALPNNAVVLHSWSPMGQCFKTEKSF